MTEAEHRAWWAENTDVPYGFCWCGCGGETRKARQGSTTQRHVKGQPIRFMHGHSRVPAAALTRKSKAIEYRRRWSAETNVAYGHCWCGCGQTITVATQTDGSRDRVEGEPTKYVRGHGTVVVGGAHSLSGFRRAWALGTDVPYGHCWCGCEVATSLARQSSSRRGWLKGEPTRYLPGHEQRLRAKTRRGDVPEPVRCLPMRMRRRDARLPENQRSTGPSSGPESALRLRTRSANQAFRRGQDENMSPLQGGRAGTRARY